MKDENYLESEEVFTVKGLCANCDVKGYGMSRTHARKNRNSICITCKKNKKGYL